MIDDFSVDNDHGAGNLIGKHVSALQAIRRYCWTCMGGHEVPWRDSQGAVIIAARPVTEVRECTSKTCWLYPYRNGRNPYVTRGKHADGLQIYPVTPSAHAVSGPKKPRGE